MPHVHAVAPGRVNLIGDHTDYTGGFVLPMAVDRYTEIRGVVGGDRIKLVSHDMHEPLDISTLVDQPHKVDPTWGRYVAGVAAELAALGTSIPPGIDGNIVTDIPIAGGLSSSAALEVATALALGFDGSTVELARLCQRAENRSSGVPTGIMDQFAIAAGIDDHALLIDCDALTVTPVPIPPDVEIVVCFIAQRTLVGSAYADRVAECARAEIEIGPLRHATPHDAARIAAPVVRARASHVTSENQRVLDFADALRVGALAEAGRLMVESHASLRDQFETSTPLMDATVERLVATPGVYGARMTGGGFGGCVVALTEPGTLEHGWVVRAVEGAGVTVT